MSTYTSLVRDGLKTRYWYSKSTSNPLPQDEWSPHDPMLLRVATLANPGRAYFSSQGNLEFRNDRVADKWPGSTIPKPVNHHEGITFMVPGIRFWGSYRIDNDDYLNEWMWFNQDYTLENLAAYGLDSRVVDGLYSAIDILDKLRSRIDWIPSHVYATWRRCIEAGGVPIMLDTRTIMGAAGGSVAALPSFLTTEERRFAWDQLCGTFRKVYSDINHVGSQHYAQEAARIQSDVAFWENVAGWSGVDKLQALWDGIKTKVRKFNAHQAASRTALAELDRLAAIRPEVVTPDMRARIESSRAEVANNSAGMRKALTPAVINVLEAETGGVGIVVAAILLLGLPALTVISVAIIVWIDAAQRTSERTQNALKDFVTARDVFDNAQYEAEMEKLRQQESALLAQQTSLAPSVFQQQLATIQAQKTSITAELDAKRRQTQAALAEMAHQLTEAGSGPMERVLNAAKKASIPIALGVGLIMVAPRMMKNRRN